jgi:hypothetical protein
MDIYSPPIPRGVHPQECVFTPAEFRGQCSWFHWRFFFELPNEGEFLNVFDRTLVYRTSTALQQENYTQLNTYNIIPHKILINSTLIRRSIIM